MYMYVMYIYNTDFLTTLITQHRFKHKQLKNISDNALSVKGHTKVLVVFQHIKICMKFLVIEGHDLAMVVFGTKCLKHLSRGPVLLIFQL
jgi:hypothetical protein